jgi:hypothetical protein
MDLTDDVSALEVVLGSLNAHFRPLCFWIGIASRGEEGVRARWNSKYRPMGMSHLDILMTSDNRSAIIEAEKLLIQKLNFDPCLANINAGGGGLAMEGPYCLYYAYLIDPEGNDLCRIGMLPEEERRPGISKFTFEFIADHDPRGEKENAKWGHEVDEEEYEYDD